MIYLILPLLLFGYIFFCVMKQYLMYKKVAHIPGPTPLPFVGNALELGNDGKELLAKFHGLIKKYGSVVRMCIGQQNGIIITDPEHINHVLTLAAHSYKGDFYSIVKPLIGDGLVTATGQKWVRHRRILNTAFSSQQLNKYVVAFNQISNTFVEKLKDKVRFNPVDPVDITEIVFNIALTAICKTAMRVEFTENTAFHIALNKMFKLFTQRFMSPLKRNDLLYRFTEEYRQTMECASKVHGTVQNVIINRKEELMKNSAKVKNISILDKLFSISEEDALTDEELRYEILTFISAGSESTGVTISFGTYELSKHPSVQKKILEEIESITGSRSTEADLSFAELQQMKYTECVLKEIWRMYTPVPFISRVIQSETYLDDFYIPANTLVTIFLHGLHMSENIYPHPERFDPDRFLPENCNDRHPSSYIPFASGLRTCIGEKFVMLEAKAILAKIIRNFEIFQHPEHKLVLAAYGTLRSANGLPVILKLRQPSM